MAHCVAASVVKRVPLQDDLLVSAVVMRMQQRGYFLQEHRATCQSPQPVAGGCTHQCVAPSSADVVPVGQLLLVGGEVAQLVLAWRQQVVGPVKCVAADDTFPFHHALCPLTVLSCGAYPLGVPLSFDPTPWQLLALLSFPVLHL